MDETSECEYLETVEVKPFPFSGGHVWTMRDGRTIPVDRMTHGHIDNALRMVRRKGLSGWVRILEQELSNRSKVE